MYDIKLLTEKTDFLKINLNKIDWDLEYNNVPYDVYQIDDYYHTIGGHFGTNNYWCCKSCDEPSFEKLVAFNGKSPIWGIEYKQDNRSKNKWGSCSIEYYGKAIITRNGKAFYGFGARSIEYGLAKAQVLLTEIQEHPIPFHFRNWREEVINREIYYQNQPAIIEDIYESGENGISIKIIPDKRHINIFEKPIYMSEDYDIEYYEEAYKNGVRDDILASSIYWFRGT